MHYKSIFVFIQAIYLELNSYLFEYTFHLNIECNEPCIQYVLPWFEYMATESYQIIILYGICKKNLNRKEENKNCLSEKYLILSCICSVSHFSALLIT